MRLRAPEGGFLIFPLSPETCWTDEAKGDGNDYASWRWNVTPQRRGRARLHISAQTLDANGMTAEAALPDQVIKVSCAGELCPRPSQGGWLGPAHGWRAAPQHLGPRAVPGRIGRG